MSLHITPWQLQTNVHTGNSPKARICESVLGSKFAMVPPDVRTLAGVMIQYAQWDNKDKKKREERENH